MSEPSALAFVHPAWMVASLVMAVAPPRLGLEIRRRRANGQAIGAPLRARHLRFGKWAIAMVAIGFVAGPVSMILFRERAAFDSFHGVLGLIVLGLFAWTGFSGRALSRGDPEARDIHRIAAAAAIGSAMLSAVAGFVLLP
jgi:hypothetical protein